MAKRQPRLPSPPVNPYGAHPGAGWAPPPGVVEARRRAVGKKRIIVGALAGYLAFFYVVLPLVSRLL
ncbi:hypothetical protein FM076_12450 [Streptomyces albus subsp. chlorinus]|uniref:hypothetical protein n=1 Tax=Streptomyces albus TaxID=1888 RepID=UPI00156E498A|nr:hypothetical protein [Streptomyces albus]NSC21965.1 hypothetical protein [Streptomyces albus subsp. chlorinus]